jgi:hypothetical protein
MSHPSAVRLTSALVVALALVGGLLVPTPAYADTSPPPGTPATVAADRLPTWQINGVV